MSVANMILRGIPGAMILNSGIGKLGLDKDSAAYLQQMASKGVPQVAELDPETFGKILAGSEIALGSALLFPAVPTRLAGLGLTAFSAAMLSMYFRTEGMTEEDGIRPTQEGTALAKDSWLTAIGLALALGGARTKTPRFSFGSN